MLLLSESREEKHFLDKAKIALVPLIRIHRQDKGVLNIGLRGSQKVCVAAAPLWLLMVRWTWLVVDATVATLTEAPDSKANPQAALLDMRPDRANVTATVILLGGQ